MREEAFLRPTFFMLGGLLIWAAHFTGIYGLNALACARGFASTSAAGLPMIAFAIGLATLIAVLGLAGLAWAAWRWPAGRARSGLTPFLRQTAILVVGLALVAVLWQALPVLLVPPCA